MATFRRGNMWTCFSEVDIFCFTANSTIKHNGALVMGAGMAKEIRDKLPDIDLKAGNKINQYSRSVNEYSLYPKYGFLVIKRDSKPDIGIFQVKRHFKKPAELDLIRQACNYLFSHLFDNPYLTVALNFPGIGYGQLDRDEVLPIISLLPDNVEIWEYPQ